MTEPMRPLPCDEPCPKCGARDIIRRFIGKGDLVAHDGFGKCKNKYASEQGYTWIATRDHIHHHCRTCQFSWQSMPLKIGKKVS